ncbi:hypothetical protein [Flagellimonas sp.]|uniref:hypothetical protein n=1 Tax=Flagellimonas sp. TaxID=2058762 RepID=UPI003F4A53C6
MTEKTFDFWEGEWDLTWDNGDGTKARGINKIIKILDGKVIQENFEDPESGFKGTSISVYNPAKKQWHQAWADNQGGYYDFIGEIMNNHPIFKTKPVIKENKEIVHRMVFKDIEEGKFTWDWESTNNGGNTWRLLWRIQYHRRE